MNAKIVLFAAAVVAALSACVDVSGPGGFECLTEAPDTTAARGDTTVTVIGVRYLNITNPVTDTVAGACDRVTIHYRAFVEGETTPFDSTTTTPITFRAGGGELAVAGLDVGVIGMKLKGKRRIFIPPTLGFGDRDVVYKGKTIPANSPLVFDVELVKVIPEEQD